MSSGDGRRKKHAQKHLRRLVQRDHLLHSRFAQTKMLQTIVALPVLLLVAALMNNKESERLRETAELNNAGRISSALVA